MGGASETRCYCNEASCVATGYMCKSRLGACFSQLTPDGASIRSVHGCAEALPEVDRQEACGGRTDGARQGETGDDDDGGQAEDRGGGRVMAKSDGRTVLVCCRQDMCNYMDSAGLSGHVSKHVNLTLQLTSNGTKYSLTNSR